MHFNEHLVEDPKDYLLCSKCEIVLCNHPLFALLPWQVVISSSTSTASTCSEHHNSAFLDNEPLQAPIASSELPKYILFAMIPWERPLGLPVFLLVLITLFLSLVPSVAASEYSEIERASNQSLLWGPYRPNLYFGVRPRVAKSLLTGILWAKVEDYQSVQHSKPFRFPFLSGSYTNAL